MFKKIYFLLYIIKIQIRIRNSSSLAISIKVNYLQRFCMIKYNGKTFPVYYKIKFYEKM